MLDLKFIREQPEIVQKAITDKNIKLDLQALLELDRLVLQLKRETEEVQAERNRNAKAGGQLMPYQYVELNSLLLGGADLQAVEARKHAMQIENRAVVIEKGKQLGAKLAQLEPSLRDLEAGLRTL